jgi:hypothetical protein
VTEELPELRLSMESGQFRATILGETLSVRRAASAEEGSEGDALPEDLDEEGPGP